MTEIAVRVLGEDDWSEYRAIRLAALEESPQAFVATYDEEAAQPEDYWRARMVRAHRLLAESAGVPVGVASVGPMENDPDSADVWGLWVAPEARSSGVASRLVQAAIDRALGDGRTKLFYWVSTENGRAIAFASNAGFRVTSHRRTARVNHPEFGDQEIAMVMSLDDDPGAVPTSMEFRLNSDHGPR